MVPVMTMQRVFWFAVIFCFAPLLEAASFQHNVRNPFLKGGTENLDVKDQDVAERSISKRSGLSEANMDAIFKEVFQEARSGLTKIVPVTEKYYGLMGDLKSTCSRENKPHISCDLVVVLRQLMILKGMYKQIRYTKVRSLLGFKDIDKTKYLEQLKLSRDFRMLLTDVKFDQNTVISVTQKVGSGLRAYLSAVASFDRDIGKADVGFITGRLKETKKGSKRLWDDKVSTSLSVILTGAVTVLSAEVAEKAVAFAVSLLECINPLAIFSGNCDATEWLDRAEQLMTATRNLANAGRLLTGLGKLKDEIIVIKNKFKKNEKQLKDMKTILDTFVAATDEVKKSTAKNYIEKYGAYTPAVTDQDLARMSAALDYVASTGCDLIAGAGGVSGNTGGIILDNALDYCATIGPDLAELESFYEDMFSFQFELIDAFTAIVRAEIAIAYSNSIPSTTQINVRPMVIGLLMDEIKIQKTAREVCDEFEYDVASSRPELCKTMFFSDGALEALISYRGSTSTSEIIHYAYIPTKPSSSLNDKTFVNIDMLISGKDVYFRPPYNDLDWLKTYKWIPQSYDVETGFYVQRMDVFVPGIKCKDGPDMPVSISIDVSNQKTVRVHPSPLIPSYLIPSKTLSFRYTDNTGYCQPCSELNFPVKENSKPGEIKKKHKLCVKSDGVISKCQSASLPSLYSTWKIRLVSEGCDIVKDTSLGYDPMITVALTKVEAKAVTDECWPNPCQYRGVCADKIMDFVCECKSPMTGKLCNEVKSGYEGQSPDACDMTTNIALKRPSQQSSLYFDQGRVVFMRASMSNDEYTGSGDFMNCSHTNMDDKAYWYVELPITHKVCAVKITNRGDSANAASRLGNAKVVISDRNPSLPNRVETLCGTVKSNPGNGEVITITCAAPIPASKGRFLTLYLPKKEYLHICDFQAFTTKGTSPAFSTTPSLWKKCDWTTNIAVDESKRKEVKQSSTYNHWTGVDKLTDGIYDTSDYRKCTHTKYDREAWAAIEFKSKQEICGVKILQRGDDTASRNAHAKVGVMDKIPLLGMATEKDKFKLCGSLPGTIRKGDLNYITCETFPVTGTTLVIYLPGTNYMNLCEVEVYATKP